MESFESENFSKPREPIAQKVTQPETPTSFNQESLSAILDEIELLREQIHYWRSIEALKNQELQNLEQKLKEANEELEATYQELMYTNLELGDALRFKNKSLAEVKDLATTILASEKSASECLAEFISNLYSFPVNPEELEFNVKLSNKTQLLKGYIKTNRVISESRELRNELKVHLNSLKTQFAALKNGYKQILTETRINIVIPTNPKRTSEP